MGRSGFFHRIAHGPQRGANPFFDGGVIERTVEHLVDRTAGLDGPGQQMSDVFRRWAKHLGVQKSPGDRIDVDIEAATAAPDNASAACADDHNIGLSC